MRRENSLLLMNFNQIAFSSTQGTNEPSPTASISNICPGTWNLALPPAAAGSFYLALHSVFSTQALTGCEGLVASLIFPHTRSLMGGCNSGTLQCISMLSHSRLPETCFGSVAPCLVSLTPGFCLTGCEVCFSTRFRFSRCSLGSLGELQCLS